MVPTNMAHCPIVVVNASFGYQLIVLGISISATMAFEQIRYLLPSGHDFGGPSI